MRATTVELLRAAAPRMLYFSLLNTMRRHLAGCSSCLDIGCGPHSPVRLLRFSRSTGLEAHPPALEEARRNRTHTEVAAVSATELGGKFAAGEFDCCVALDLIEHLTPADGLVLIREMERIARKRVLIFTPNGFLEQRSVDGDLQEHLSGWTPEQMRELGFRVIGMHGWKGLRGGEHRHRIRPAALSGVLSLLTHYCWTVWSPRHAAAILCVKEVEGEGLSAVRGR
jgi:hypothetical protein